MDQADRADRVDRLDRKVARADPLARMLLAANRPGQARDTVMRISNLMNRLDRVARPAQVSVEILVEILVEARAE